MQGAVLPVLCSIPAHPVPTSREKHCPVMMSQWKTARHMDMPTPGVIAHLSRHLDQPSDHPLQRPTYNLAFHIIPSDQVEQIVGNDAHEKPRLVGLKSPTTGLIPAKHELALLDPVLHVTATVVDLDDLLRG